MSRPIHAIASSSALPIDLSGARAAALDAAAARATPSPAGTGFAQIVANGLGSVAAKVGKADALIEAYAVGDPVPIHQVTLALEEARISVDLAIQVRTRLLEVYRDFMAMQL